MEKVDVVICCYGKPYQTAVTLFSLMEKCGQHIDKIYLLDEPKELYNDDISFILPWFSNIVHYVRKRSLYCKGYADKNLEDEEYRLSLRYQYAWENTDKKYLFACHNDCVFREDIIGKMLARIEGVAGIGLIGQCWNCPAKFANLCNGDNHDKYRPTYAEVLELLEKYPSPRTKRGMIDQTNPMPLPECRLNEFACLINLELIKKEVYPIGDIVPFGTMQLDHGTEWFRSLILRGYKFLNLDIYKEGVDHAPFGTQSNGYSQEFSVNEYQIAEERAKKYLEEHYHTKCGKL